MNNRTELIETKEDKVFFKLLIRESENKKLRQEIGFLQSEKDEIQYKFEKVSQEFGEYKRRYSISQKELDNLDIQDLQRRYNDLEASYKKTLNKYREKYRALKKELKKQEQVISDLINKLHTKQ